MEATQSMVPVLLSLSGGVILMLIAIIGFFIKSFYNSTKMLKCTVNDLNLAVGKLTTFVNDQEKLSEEKFASIRELTKINSNNIKRIEQKIR